MDSPAGSPSSPSSPVSQPHASSAADGMWRQNVKNAPNSTGGPKPLGKRLLMAIGTLRRMIRGGVRRDYNIDGEEFGRGKYGVVRKATVSPLEYRGQHFLRL